MKIQTFFLHLFLLSSCCFAHLLHLNHYQSSCPNVESIVKAAVKQKFEQTFVTAPATLRLFFHDCFVRVMVKFFVFWFEFWWTLNEFFMKFLFDYVWMWLQGCDASVLIQTNDHTSEKDNADNLSLAGDGFDTVIKAKAAVDSVPGCKNKVSCADILALATRDVVVLVSKKLASCFVFCVVTLGRSRSFGWKTTSRKTCWWFVTRWRL